MNRRDFHHYLLLGAAAYLPLVACADQEDSAHTTPVSWESLEAAVAGRLGVSVLDTADGSLAGYRLDERFPMCSTFKWLAAALVLARVDAGQERIERRIHYGPELLMPHSPVTERHAGSDGMTLAALCEAAITLSDNTAGNLLLDSFGGPAVLTRYSRSLGDSITRFDRREPALNEATPGDPRDTTTPRAMTLLLRSALIGDALSADGRAQLVHWMEATRTNTRRLRAGLPKGWRLGSKTGSGAHGTANDVGVYWPTERAPVVVAVYLTETAAPEADRNNTVARVAQAVTTGRWR